MYSLLVAFIVVACNNAGGGGSSSSSTGGGTTGTKTGINVGNTNNVSTDQCAIFQNNSHDYTTCTGCKTTMCPCTQIVGGVCVSTNISACTVDFNQLVQCVHDNLAAAGGPCVGLRCGDGQTADFTSCTCKSATPPTSIGPPPGQDDQSSPYVEPGLFINTRYCPKVDITSANASVAGPMDCLRANAGKSGSYAGTPPRYLQQPPANVLQDVGYIRWDLALDASQYPPGAPLFNNQNFMGTWSTIPIASSMFYQLKPNTTLSTDKVFWKDCVEHFSGYDSGAGPTILLTANAQCGFQAGGAGSTTPPQVQITTTTPQSGTAVEDRISANGSAANELVTNFSTDGNLNLRTSSGADPLGIAKQDTGVFAADSTTVGTGVFSNVGNYKFSWGPVRVRRSTLPPGSPDVASTTVTSRIAINTNLGYMPASAVESTAASPSSITNSVAGRDCSTTFTPNPCVVTAVYRAPGGSILSQSFSPAFSTNNESSTVSALPDGIVASSTPKIIEDITQLDIVTQTTPARLRVFVRATDGNIYMSRFDGGTWHSWMSLGRPWICNASGATSPCVVARTTGIPVYAPYIKGAGDPITGYTGGDNDGLSIASEPSVASYMEPTTGKGFIGIFVRVSQIYSTTGLAGPMHNSVWFTFAATQAPKTAAGVTLDFDNARTWSNWMPIWDGANLLTIQGNPLALARCTDDTTGQSPPAAGDTCQDRFYVFGTDSHNGAVQMLHPPIAPKTGDATKSGAMAAHWFNYGNGLSRTGINVSAFTGGTQNWVYKSISTMPWDVVATIPTAHNAIVSDWTAVMVDPNAASNVAPNRVIDSNRIRLIANGLDAQSCGGGIAPLTVTGPISPCFYQRSIEFFDMMFINTFADGLNPICGGVKIPNLSFFGNITAVNLGDIIVGGGSTAFSSVLNPVNTSPSNISLIAIFGRGVCPNKNKCDNVNPTAAYGVLLPNNACGGAPGAGTMYYTGMSVTDSGGQNTFQTVQPINITADIFAAFSHAKANMNSDAPVYLITRDVNGKIVHGTWGSFSNQTTGNKTWSFFPSGSFTN